MKASGDREYAFSGYRLDVVHRQLSGVDGTVLPLTSKSFDVLLYLIEHRDRLLGKDELLSAVWPGRVIEENNLTQAISSLRRALGSNAGDHRYIVTVPGRGYRFVAPLDGSGDGEAPVADRTDSTVPAVRRWRGPALAVTALVSLVALSLFAIAQRQEAGQDTHAVAARALPAAATRDSPAPILAVLPFKSIGDPVGERDTVLGLGMADTLIARLSEATSLRVLSLGSVHRFSGLDVDPLHAGKRLGAGYIVDGSTQRDGDTIRVNARLVSLPEGRTVWAGTFDEHPERVFTLQDAIARGITEAMSLRYAGGSVHRSPCDGADAQAYRAYLGGRHLMFRPNRFTLPKAIVSMREAIDRDPLCARAWAGLAFAYRSQAMTADQDPREAFPKAKAAIAHALAIDPRSAEAYASKGAVEFWYDWDWAASEASLRHAITLDDNLSEAHYALAHLFNNLNRHDEAERHGQAATTLDPLSPVINTVVASFYINTGKFAEANRRLDNVLELDPEFWVALYMRGAIALAHGDLSGAKQHFQRAERSCGGCSHAQSMLVLVHARIGERDRAEQLLAGMEARDRSAYFPATRLALANQALGHEDRALDLLERAHAERDLYLSFLVVDPRWRGLQGHPRFRALVRRMRLDMPSESSETPPRIDGGDLTMAR